MAGGLLCGGSGLSIVVLRRAGGREYLQSCIDLIGKILRQTQRVCVAVDNSPVAGCLLHTIEFESSWLDWVVSFRSFTAEVFETLERSEDEVFRRHLNGWESAKRNVLSHNITLQRQRKERRDRMLIPNRVVAIHALKYSFVG